MKRVFLGGTCNGSLWRDNIIPMLDIDYFNPVVEDWTQECMTEEKEQRASCDFCLYVITPKMKGVYSIAEVVDDSNKRPEKTLLVIIKEDDHTKFNSLQWKHLISVANMVIENGGNAFWDLESAAKYINEAPADEGAEPVEPNAIIIPEDGTYQITYGLGTKRIFLRKGTCFAKSK